MRAQKKGKNQLKKEERVYFGSEMYFNDLIT